MDRDSGGHAGSHTAEHVSPHAPPAVVRPGASRRPCRVGRVPAGVLLARGTLQASQGAQTPTAAAHYVIDSLNPFGDTSIGPYLCDGHDADLRHQLDAIRDQLRLNDGTMPRLQAEPATVQQDGDTATVTIPVVPMYHTSAGTFRDDTKPWVFHTRNAHGPLVRGWQVCQLDPPPLP